MTTVTGTSFLTSAAAKAVPVVVDRAAAEFVYMGSPKADDRHAMSSRGRSANGPPRDDVRSVPKSLPVPAAASADVSLAINASKVLAASYSFEETHPSAYLASYVQPSKRDALTCPTSMP